MAGNLFKRYVWLLDLIQRTGGIKYEYINRNWWENYRLNETHEPLPKRTLQNHIKAIYEMFGIEIECDRKRDYKYVIKNPENIEKIKARALEELEEIKTQNQGIVPDSYVLKKK